MEIYMEIELLKQYFRKNSILIKQGKGSGLDGFLFASLTIDSKSWEVLIEDEYDDFNEANQLICLFLVLVSLEIYAESADYLFWCKENNIDSADLKWLEYYKSLEIVYQEVETKLGRVDSCISSYDYSLRTGVVKHLLVEGLNFKTKNPIA